jgi:hypothetical protein
MIKIIVASESLDALEEWVDALCEAFGAAKPDKLEVVDIADIEANAAVTGSVLIFDEISCTFREQRAVLVGECLLPHSCLPPKGRMI